MNTMGYLSKQIGVHLQ